MGLMLKVENIEGVVPLCGGATARNVYFVCPLLNLPHEVVSAMRDEANTACRAIMSYVAATTLSRYYY